MFKAPLKHFWIVICIVVLAGCGGSATPEVQVVETTVAEDPTDVPPTDEPIVTEEATVEVEMTEEIVTTLIAPEPTAVASGNTPQEAVIAANVEAADIAEGERLYTQKLIPACTTCHMIDATTREVAPSLAGISERAGTRVEGQGAFTYAYNSIRYANDHVVEGYQEGLMPVYDGVLTDQEVYDLIAYIWTLEEE